MNPSSLPLYQVRARALTGFAELVGQLGGQSDALLHQVGLDSGVLLQPDATLDHTKVIQLYELAVRALDAPDFGLRLASLQYTGVLGPIALMANHAATVRDAVQAVIRHFPYHTTDTTLSLEVDEGSPTARLLFSSNLPENCPRRQNNELILGVAVHFLRDLSAETGKNWQAHLTHLRGLTTAHYRRHLGCKVLLGQARNELIFPSEMLDRPINNSQPQLAQAAKRFVDHEMRRFPLDLAKQVDALVSRKLTIGSFGLTDVAPLLNMSVRTLQRRLKQQGSDFGDIVDTARRKRAYELITLGALPLGQIHTLVGYEDQSSFIRACQRWFGTSPGRLRDTA